MPCLTLITACAHGSNASLHHPRARPFLNSLSPSYAISADASPVWDAAAGQMDGVAHVAGEHRAWNKVIYRKLLQVDMPLPRVQA